MSSQMPDTVQGGGGAVGGGGRDGLWREGGMNFPAGFNVANFELAWGAEVS